MENQTTGTQIPKEKKVIKKRGIGLERYMIANGKAGEVFFSDYCDRDLVTLSVKLGRKISTELHYSIKVSHKREGRRIIPEAIMLTKVTLL